jgi:hypothetical protein
VRAFEVQALDSSRISVSLELRVSSQWQELDKTWLENLVESGRIYKEIDGYYVLNPDITGFLEASQQPRSKETGLQANHPKPC